MNSGSKIRVLDLFCGGGGSSYGARRAGGIVMAGVDGWEMAARTYKSNFKRSLHITLKGEVPQPQITKFGPIDLLLASPECTSHTCARGARPRSDDSRMTAFQVTTYAAALQPRWIVIENVIHMKSWSKYPDFMASLESLGYKTQPLVLDSVDFGIPQTRKRLFIVCSRDHNFEFQVPEPIKSAVARDILDKEGAWPVTPLFKKGRAKATLERAERAFGELGRNEAFLLVYYGSDGAGGWQSLDRPLRTLTTLDRFALVEPSPHGHTMRMLQVPELRRAMGFGDDFRLHHGTRRDKIKLLGNGVCPPVMEAIVKGLPKEGSRRPVRARSSVVMARPAPDTSRNPLASSLVEPVIR